MWWIQVQTAVSVPLSEDQFTTSQLVQAAKTAYSITKDNRYETRAEMKLNPAGYVNNQRLLPDGIWQGYQYDDHHQVVVMVQNARADEVKYTGFEEVLSADARLALWQQGEWTVQGALGGWSLHDANRYAGMMGFDLSAARTVNLDLL